MLITKIPLIVTLTTYLCCLSHTVQSRYMTVHQNPDQSISSETADYWKSAMISTGNSQSQPDNVDTPTIISTNHQHKHRHHNYLNNGARISFSSSSVISFPRNLPTKTNTEHLYLYNRCSGKYVNLMSKSINANGTREEKHVISLKSKPIGDDIAVTIFSETSGVYLCFNVNGKLIARFDNTSDACLFKEIPQDSKFLKYVSFYNNDWSIGFNFKGKPMRGTINPNIKSRSKRRKEKCTHFSKEKINDIYGPKLNIHESSHEIFATKDKSRRLRLSQLNNVNENRNAKISAEQKSQRLSHPNSNSGLKIFESFKPPSPIDSQIDNDYGRSRRSEQLSLNSSNTNPLDSHEYNRNENNHHRHRHHRHQHNHLHDHHNHHHHNHNHHHHHHRHHHNVNNN